LFLLIRLGKFILVLKVTFLNMPLDAYLSACLTVLEEGKGKNEFVVDVK
jgi:hypothetical protein